MPKFQWLGRFFRKTFGCALPDLAQYDEGAGNPAGGAEFIASWGENANCYAYAVSCLTPQNGIGGAVPGAASGAAAQNSANGNYRQELAEAAARDGLILADGVPDDPPTDIRNHYLVALIANDMGFHWLRRDPTTLRWSWKDGNAGPVQLNVFSVARSRYVHIENRDLNDLLGNPMGFAPWVYGSMRFVAFFHVPMDGLSVAGNHRAA